MPGLAEHKIQMVRGLVEASPDRVVGALQRALEDVSGDEALAEIRALVETEARDRRLRNAALEPVAAMFVGDGRAADRLSFPARALGLIWRGLKATRPSDVARAAATLADFLPGESSSEAFDALTAAAAAALRSRSIPEFQTAAEICDQARPGGADLLAGCLDLAPVVRRAVGKLGGWISRASDANAAAARLAYKDAVTISEDATFPFFEMLAAQLAQPWQVLKIVSAVMDRPGEKYLAGSELAPFALRVMDDIDRGLKVVMALDADGGLDAGVAVARALDDVTQKLAELEESIELNREGGLWGARVTKQKQALLACVEQRLRAAEKAVKSALPTEPAKMGKLMTDAPCLAVAPDARAVTRALALLAFASETRASAVLSGFVSSRAKLFEGLAADLTRYLEEVLERMRRGDVKDAQIAQRYLDVVADFTGLVQDRKAAELVRRRAAAAAAAVPAPPPTA